jgi:hypothetical protein
MAVSRSPAWARYSPADEAARHHRRQIEQFAASDFSGGKLAGGQRLCRKVQQL